MNDNILWLNKLVPKHILLKESEIDEKLNPLNITRDQLPKILLKDPALKALDEAFEFEKAASYISSMKGMPNFLDIE